MRIAYDRGGGRPFNGRLGLASLAFLVLSATGATAANDRDTCTLWTKILKADEAREEACGRFIKSGGARGRELAIAYNNRAFSLYLRKEYDRALPEFNEAVRLWPDSAIIRENRGQLFFDLAQYDRAIAEFDEAILHSPKSAFAYDWRAAAYHRKLDYARALEDYGKSIKIDAKSASPYLGRCEVYIETRDYDRALPQCEEAILREPKGDGVLRRCEVYAEKDDLDRAFRECDAYLGRFPKSISGGLYRGYIYEQKGEVTKAIADYQRALESDPTGKNVHVPVAIGAALDDVKVHLARLQAPAAPVGQTQGDARVILEQRGLFGVWSANCNATASPQNSYTVYRAIDARRVQRDVMIGATQRSEAGLIESVIADGGDIAYLQTGQTRDEVIVRMDGNRARLVELSRNGVRVIGDGHYLASDANGAVAGQPTPWLTRCQ